MYIRRRGRIKKYQKLMKLSHFERRYPTKVKSERSCSPQKRRLQMEWILNVQHFCTFFKKFGHFLFCKNWYTFRSSKKSLSKYEEKFRMCSISILNTKSNDTFVIKKIYLYNLFKLFWIIWGSRNQNYWNIHTATK